LLDVDPTGGRDSNTSSIQARIDGLDIRVGVLTQDGLNALAKLVQLFLQNFVLGVVGFGSHIACKFIEFVESEVKHGALPRLRYNSQPVGYRVIGEEWR
jgi:hypothetical protein